MPFETTKKKILAVKFISCIIINILRLRELQTNIMNSNLLDKVSLIKDLSRISYDIISFNITSILFNSYPLYVKLKKIIGNIIKKRKLSLN